MDQNNNNNPSDPLATLGVAPGSVGSTPPPAQDNLTPSTPPLAASPVWTPPSSPSQENIAGSIPSQPMVSFPQAAPTSFVPPDDLSQDSAGVSGGLPTDSTVPEITTQSEETPPFEQQPPLSPDALGQQDSGQPINTQPSVQNITPEPSFPAPSPIDVNQVLGAAEPSYQGGNQQVGEVNQSLSNSSWYNTNPNLSSAPEENPSPLTSEPVNPGLSESMPTDLSHLVGNNEVPEAVVVDQASKVPENLVVTPAPSENQVVSGASSSGLPKWIFLVGGGVLILVAAASAYFILGVGKSEPPAPVSVPAVQEPLTNPPKTVVPTAVPSSTPSADTGFGNVEGSAQSGVQGSTPSGQTTPSAMDLLRRSRVSPTP